MMTSENLVAFMGVGGAHADLACRQSFPYMNTLALPSFKEVFDAVDSGRAKIGMIPVENSQAGRVAEIHNLIPDYDLYITGEFFQRIEHHLYGIEGAEIKDVKEVYSHPQALMQCRESIAEMGVKQNNHSNTAVAAKDVGEWNDKSKAAICSQLAGEIYGLKLLKKNFEDSDENTTVFAAISKDQGDPDKSKTVLTTLLFTIRNIPGALYKSLGGIATNGINMIKLESYIPSGASKKAQFFMTFEGSPEDDNVKLALEELGFFCSDVRVLGIYNAAKERK